MRPTDNIQFAVAVYINDSRRFARMVVSQFYLPEANDGWRATFRTGGDSADCNNNEQ